MGVRGRAGGLTTCPRTVTISAIRVKLEGLVLGLNQDETLGREMATGRADPTVALVSVVKALEPLKEPDRQWVLHAAASKWSLGPVVGSPAVLQQTENGGRSAASIGMPSADVQSALSKKDVRAFIRAKKPATDVQRVACLVYFLTQTTGQPGASAKEIGQAHTDSGASKMNMARAIDNATRRSKYLSVRDGRQKQLTTLGEDVVDVLPDQSKVKELESAGKARGAKRARENARRKKKV
jgi:hypothetical protein